MKKIFLILLSNVLIINCLYFQNYVLSPLGIKFPNYTTATRPAANKFGVGTVLYNSTDNVLQFSQGSSWLNVAGTTALPVGANAQTLRNNGSGWVSANSLESISGLKGYNYYLKNEKNPNLQTGFIAQEIQKIFPELVNQGSDGYLSVDYTGLIPHLVESVKSLKSENDSLKERLLKIENFLNNSELKLEAKR